MDGSQCNMSRLCSKNAASSAHTEVRVISKAVAFLSKKFGERRHFLIIFKLGQTTGSAEFETNSRLE